MSEKIHRPALRLETANARKLGIVGLTVTALIASGHVLFNTRTGVHAVFEIFGIGGDTPEWVASPEDPPVPVVQTAALTRSLTYPGEILQPSGIAWDASADQFLIVTDQAELFAVSRHLDKLLSRTTMSRAPLIARQGSVETVAALESGAVVAGRDHSLPTWQAADGVWRRGEPLRTDGSGLPMSGDVTAMAFEPGTGRLFAADEDGALWRQAQSGSGWEPLVLSGEVREGRTLDEYRIVGLEYSAGRLYALTAHYPNILVIDPASGRIEQAFALDGLQDQSGLAIVSGEAFVTVDHEYDEASPGLMVFDLGG